MAKEAHGVVGADIGIGGEILKRAAVDDEFASASRAYFDNDEGAFGAPQPDALNPEKSAEVVRLVESVLAKLA